MSFSMKEFAEALLKASATEQNYEELVRKMNSTNNTLKEDIDKLREGAKLECKVDVDKIAKMVDEISGYRYSVEDELSSARGYIEDAESSCSYLEDEVNSLLSYLEELTHELPEEKEEDTKEE